MSPFRIAAFAAALVLPVLGAGAQTAIPSATPPGVGGAAPMPHLHRPMENPTAGSGAAVPATAPMRAPTEAGQSGFAAIQEIVRILEADPATDWSRVDIDALRQHLIDMDEVTLRAAARKTQVEGGLRIEVTGTGRTLEAIQRMIPAHAKEISGMNGWTAAAGLTPGGVEMTVTAGNAAEVRKIRALGFMGIMAQGGHHQAHHLAMARGLPLHAH